MFDLIFRDHNHQCSEGKGTLKKEEHQRQKRLLQEKALLKVCSINRCISQKERKFSLSSSALPLLLLDDDFPKKKLGKHLATTVDAFIAKYCFLHHQL